MFYRMKIDKKEELLEGKTITHVANLCDISRVYLSYILNSSDKKKISKKCVENIITKLSENSIKINTKLQNTGMEQTIEYFFKKIK